MSLKNLFAALCGVAVLACGQANASTLATETFSYPDGALVPNGGWANQSGTAGTLLVESGEVVVSQDSGSEDAELAFGSDIDSGILTATFDMRVEANAMAGTDFEYFAHFSNDTAFNFRGRVDVIAPVAGGDYTLGIATSSSTNESALTVDFDFGDVIPVELSWDFGTGLATVTAGGSSATSTTVDLGEVLDSFNLRQSNSSSDETIYIDNLEISLIPEPTSLALFALGAFGLVASRKRG